MLLVAVILSAPLFDGSGKNSIIDLVMMII
jgi:hypothetical protein